MIRVVIVDHDDDFLRKPAFGLGRQPDSTVVGESSNPDSAATTRPGLTVDVVAGEI
jgi:hypothetical protein